MAEIGSLTDVSAAGRLLRAALDGGINFLDTAACYGNSEEWIGRTISHRRHEYTLATKAGHVTGQYKGEEWTPKTILLALGFILAHKEVDTAIVGTRDPDHMEANIELVENELPIPAIVVQELHRRCDQLE